MPAYNNAEFIWRRLHSLSGLLLSLFILFHLLTNSQAALPFGDDGEGFIREVNWIHTLPFLPVLEFLFLGIPILIHTLWGIRYLRYSKINYLYSDGTRPILPYPRNRAYTWQRITAIGLLFLLLGHIVHMRFLNKPEEVVVDGKKRFESYISDDPGLITIQKRLHFTIRETNGASVIIDAPDFGTASLLIVRDSFKSPLMMTLYTLLVLSSTYHGFNGLWTFLITWGITLSEGAQKRAWIFCKALMVITAFLGLSAIFFTYWINLRE